MLTELDSLLCDTSLVFSRVALPTVSLVGFLSPLSGLREKFDVLPSAVLDLLAFVGISPLLPFSAVEIFTGWVLVGGGFAAVVFSNGTNGGGPEVSPTRSR